MKVSLSWLKDYVDIACSPDALCQRLTDIGLNVDDRIEIGDDTVLDLEVTSNRSDCLGLLGIAREISAAFDVPLRLPSVEFPEQRTAVADLTSVQVDAPDLCPRYTARVLQSVKVGPSPAWLVKRLDTLGVRSVNNVVDITNYVLLETGQPLHAFDYDKLAEHRIVVRVARTGEKIVAIDQSEHELNSDNLIIADTSRPVAVAGVMGGLATEIGQGTSTVLLESARFDPLSVRRTARQLNLHSDSSYRFERGVDPVNVEWASRRAAAMICELAGATAARGVVDVWVESFKPNTVALPMSLCQRILGIEIPITAAAGILTRLGFDVSADNETLTVTVPSHRADVTRPIDLVEEVGRLWGYDKVPTDQTIRITAQRKSRLEQLDLRVSEALNQCGFSEAMTLSLIEPAWSAMFNEYDPESMLKVTDHQRRVNNVLRPSLLPSLLAAARHNYNAGNDTCELYELARVYLPTSPGELPDERRHLALLSGRSLRDIRGALEHLVTIIDPSATPAFEPNDAPWFQDGQSAKVMLNDRQLGIAGVVHPSIQKQFDLKAPIAAAEINFDVIMESPLKPVRFRPLCRFPAVRRDLSIIVPEATRWESIEQSIAALNIAELDAIEFGEMFRGKQIPAGKKSIFLKLNFRHSERSLTHQEVDAHQQKIVRTLQAQCQATLRSEAK